MAGEGWGPARSRFCRSPTSLLITIHGELLSDLPPSVRHTLRSNVSLVLTKGLVWVVLCLWLLLAFCACGTNSVTGPAEVGSRMLVCMAPDTIWLTLEGRPTFMTIPRCW